MIAVDAEISETVTADATVEQPEVGNVEEATGAIDEPLVPEAAVEETTEIIEEPVVLEPMEEIG